MAGIDEYTKLMLHFNGADESTDFIDSSSSEHEVTNVGAEVDTAIKKFGTASGLFATADYLTVANSVEFDFGTGNFTIDYWVYRTGTGPPVIARDAELYTPWILGYPAGGRERLYMSSNGTGWDMASNVDMGATTQDEWVHYAVVRSGTTFYTFRNGIKISEWEFEGAVGSSSGPIGIGTGQGSPQYAGQIDELRISKGVARWTANFTPPTEEYSPDFETITRTIDAKAKIESILVSRTVQAKGTVKQLDVVRSIQAHGSVKLTEGGGIDQYTKLMLHLNGEDGSTDFPDSSDSEHEVTNDNAEIDTANPKFGTGAALFSSGDKLVVTNSNEFDFGVDDFTIDYWEYRSSTAGTVLARDGELVPGWITGYYSNGHETLYMSSTGVQWEWDIANNVDMGVITLDEWTHFALVRNGTTFYTFRNGVKISEWESDKSIVVGAGGVHIGSAQGGDNYIGHIDELRISKGIARWITNFDIPTEEYSRDIVNYSQTIESKSDIAFWAEWSDVWQVEIFETRTSTIQSKASIKKTATRDITALCSVQKNLTQTVTAKGTIKKSFTQVLTSKARIQIISNQTITAKGYIQTTQEYTQTITAKARIQKSFSKTITTKGRIKKSFTQTLTAKARIGLVSQQSVNAKTRIQIVSTQTIETTSRITISVIKTIITKASIKKLFTKTLEVKTRIQKVFTQTLTSKGRFEIASIQTINAKARITITTEKTIQAKSTIKKSITQTIEAKSSLLREFAQTIQSKSRIEITSTKIVDAKARITVFQVQTVESKGKITATISQSISAKTDIKKGITQTVEIKASILKQFNRTIDAKSRIGVVPTRTITAKGRITTVQTQTISAKSKITATIPRTIQTKGAIKLTQTQIINAKTRIQKTFNQTIGAKGRIGLTSTQTIESKARITITTGQTINSKARITAVYTQTLQSKSSISKTFTQTIDGIGRITVTEIRILTAKANIISTVNQTINSKGRIGISKEQTVQSKGRIGIAEQQTITAKAEIICLSKPILVTPTHLSVQTSPVYLVWEISSCCKNRNIHTHIEIDKTDNTFNDLEKDLYSFRDPDFEYWDGSNWQTYPTSGISSVYYGNQARVLVTLTTGNKWWSANGGVK